MAPPFGHQEANLWTPEALSSSQPTTPRLSVQNKVLSGPNTRVQSTTVAEVAHLTRPAKLPPFRGDTAPKPEQTKATCASSNVCRASTISEVDQAVNHSPARQNIASMVVERAPQLQQLQKLQDDPAMSSSERQDKAKPTEDASRPSKNGPSSLQPLGLTGASEKDQNNTPSTAVPTARNDVPGSLDGVPATFPVEDPKLAISPMTPENLLRSSEEPDSSTLPLSESHAHGMQLFSPADIPGQRDSALSQAEADKHYHAGMDSIQAGIGQLARYHACTSE